MPQTPTLSPQSSHHQWYPPKAANANAMPLKLPPPTLSTRSRKCQHYPPKATNVDAVHPKPQLPMLSTQSRNHQDYPPEAANANAIPPMPPPPSVLSSNAIVKKGESKTQTILSERTLINKMRLKATDQTK